MKSGRSYSTHQSSRSVPPVPIFPSDATAITSTTGKRKAPDEASTVMDDKVANTAGKRPKTSAATLTTNNTGNSSSSALMTNTLLSNAPAPMTSSAVTHTSSKAAGNSLRTRSAREIATMSSCAFKKKENRASTPASSELSDQEQVYIVNALRSISEASLSLVELQRSNWAHVFVAAGEFFLSYHIHPNLSNHLAQISHHLHQTEASRKLTNILQVGHNLSTQNFIDSDLNEIKLNVENYILVKSQLNSGILFRREFENCMYACIRDFRAHLATIFPAFFNHIAGRMRELSCPQADVFSDVAAALRAGKPLGQFMAERAASTSAPAAAVTAPVPTPMRR